MNKPFAPTLAVLAAAALLAVLVTQGLTTVRQVRHLPPPSQQATPLPLQPMTGAPATITLGTPNFRAAPYAASADGGTSSGIWASDGPSTFEWRFESDETVYILQGQVDVTYQGHQFSLRPGDTAVFQAGTQAVWHVPEKVLKSYTLNHPSTLTRWWRQLRG